ncbi:MAG: DUF4105 domain-containing protein [Kiritimatiellae bacterium]|nr:DUF4105 domain-containing protein [Kiritimatiellia bacterium]
MRERLVALLVLCAVPTFGEDLLDDLIFFDVNFGNRIEMGPITPEAVQGFELLYATPGAGDVSEVAGHLLLRVKLNNNPRAAELGIENPNDLVLSMLADTEAGKPPREPRSPVVQLECKKNNWFNIVADNGGDESALASIWQSLRGLSGGFCMTMDRQTLGHALKSYTIEQDRDLLRYRLNLTKEQEANLLKRLYKVRAEEKPRYYFFSQNCGSVLVRIVAEGIGDETNATFSPLVAPPHTLLGNLVRSGVATRIAPAFYSYRKEGFIARELFEEVYGELQIEHPDLPWPPLRELNHPNDAVRASSVAQLTGVYYAQPQLASNLYALASIVQEKEMIYAHKDLVCEQYTSETTAEARGLQALILADQFSVDSVVDTDKLLADCFTSVEARHATYGTAHTELYPFALGVGYVQRKHLADEVVLTIDGSLMKQDLGSRSCVAMQRSSAVTLGGVSAHIGDEGLMDWNVSALKLRKFRDTLNSVPSARVSTRGLGLGVTALDVHHYDQTEETVNVIAGVEALANLLSSTHYNDFLLLSAGAEIVHNDGYGVGVPVGFEHLWSFDNAMNWQWRNKATYDLAWKDRLDVNSSVAVRLGEMFRRDVLLVFGADYTRVHFDAESEESLILKAQIEINRW